MTVVRCKDMVAFLRYCLYLKQFCKIHNNVTIVRLKFCEAVNIFCEVHICSYRDQKLFNFQNSVKNYHFLIISRVTATFTSHHS